MPYTPGPNSERLLGLAYYHAYRRGRASRRSWVWLAITTPLTLLSSALPHLGR